MELVTPSNSLEMMRASLKSGSDAVYLPVNGYLAIRLGREFFELSQLDELVTEVQEKGKRIYPVINGGVREGEQERYWQAAEKILKSGADGVVVGSVSMIQWFKKNRSTGDFKIIASSTMAVINPEDARFYSKLGADRVILSRMHRLEEVERFCRLGDVETEIFVHGVVCPCWEGVSCLIPQLIHQNRYDGVSCLPLESSDKTPPCRSEEWWGLKIQCDLNYLERYRKMGVDSLKVIPVAKTPAGSGQIVKFWRAALDGSAKGIAQDYGRQKEKIKDVSPLPVDFGIRDF